MRRTPIILLCALCALCAAVPASAGTAYVLRGRGWGHGIGMSQYGARGFAEHGWSYDRILAHYYPGTALQTQAGATIRVLLAEKAKKLRIGSAEPFGLLDGSGRSIRVPAGTYPLGPALRLALPDGAEPLTGPVSITAGQAPLELDGHPYRGSFRVETDGKKLSLVDRVGLEEYLRGVVPREMPSDWAPEALKAQAVAARSYAAMSLHPGSPFDVHADTRSQVYGGIEAEDARTDAAIRATAREVLVYGGAIAQTYFFSTSGGRTAAIQDAWPDADPQPYLVSVDDPYDDLSPYHEWGPTAISDGQLSSHFGVSLPAQLALARDADGRVSTVTAGGRTIAGADFRAKLHLRSTWFSVVGTASLERTAEPKAYGQPLALAGAVDGVPAPSLELRIPGGAWQDSGLVAPRDDGSFRVVVHPGGPTFYRLAGEGWHGPAVKVEVDDAPAPRPASLPKAIPHWAWDVLHWQRHKRSDRPAAAPKKLPRWYWEWRAWILSR